MIWVIGGTKDSRDFLEELVKHRKDIIVTTTTEYGAKLLENLSLKVIVGKLDYDRMIDFVETYYITTIVDLSHPYAKVVTDNALKISDIKNLKYFRFEREEIGKTPKRYKEFSNVENLIEYTKNLKENILVTLGSNNIPLFRDLKNLEKFYFRILPKWEMIKRCEDNNILPKNIIAMQGPFCKNLNKAMIEQFEIKYLITKQAGNTGGELDKIEACDDMNVEVILLSRPKIQCDSIYSNIFDIIERL